MHINISSILHYIKNIVSFLHVHFSTTLVAYLKKASYTKYIIKIQEPIQKYIILSFKIYDLN
jgi:hypothetical protein